MFTHEYLNISNDSFIIIIYTWLNNGSDSLIILIYTYMFPNKFLHIYTDFYSS